MMKSQLKSDLTFNIFLPLILGKLIYLLGDKTFVEPLWIRNYIPDGLWAYAFASALLIVWQRKLNLLWLLLMFMVCSLFEWMQFNGLVPGIGDVGDILIYLLFVLLALFFNPFFKRLFNYQHP